MELVSAQKSVLGLLISLVLLTLARRRVWHPTGQAELGPGWRRPRYWLAATVAAIPLTSALGYVGLSRMLATRWVLTVGLLGAVALLRKIAAETVEQALSEDSTPGRRLRAALALSEEGAEMLAFWLGGLARLAILLLGLLGLALLWGAAWKDLAAWLAGAFLGFKVGNVSVSLGALLGALLIFAGLLTATRLLQKSLDKRIFPRTRLDAGLRHSIRSGVGYLGFTLALIFAVSALGLDLSNLALIAGALSVGIGLGLQNVVNNFVSGLILLVERPIKAGDRVAVGEHQGQVRKISVRATEIVTLDRASVFIPNSSLVSGVVINRTRAELAGRLALPLGLASRADPARARELLLGIASSHPGLRRDPPPQVYFHGFAGGALNLELVAALRETDRLLAVTSDLCFAIHAAFRREGIELAPCGPVPARK